MKTIDVFGKPFAVAWQSTDRRLICSREKCYELVSFPIPSEECKERDALRTGIPKSLVWCWILNPDYEGNSLREAEEWQMAGHEGPELPPEAFTPDGKYLPPKAPGLPVEPDETLKTVKPFTKIMAHGAYARQIVKAVFRNGRDVPNPYAISRLTPGIKAVKAMFENGEVLFLREAVERDVPDEAKAQWQTEALLKKERKPRQRVSKPSSRFNDDFSVAIIVGRTGKNTPLTIEPELRWLIRRIVEGGGFMPRTKLRNGKSDAYQPEKLLASSAARCLITAGLLGTKKSGRTTVFWAKQVAD